MAANEKLKTMTYATDPEGRKMNIKFEFMSGGGSNCVWKVAISPFAHGP